MATSPCGWPPWFRQESYSFPTAGTAISLPCSPSHCHWHRHFPACFSFQIIRILGEFGGAGELGQHFDKRHRGDGFADFLPRSTGPHRKRLAASCTRPLTISLRNPMKSSFAAMKTSTSTVGSISRSMRSLTWDFMPPQAPAIKSVRMFLTTSVFLWHATACRAGPRPRRYRQRHPSGFHTRWLGTRLPARRARGRGSVPVDSGGSVVVPPGFVVAPPSEEGGSVWLLWPLPFGGSSGRWGRVSLATGYGAGVVIIIVHGDIRTGAALLYIMHGGNALSLEYGLERKRPCYRDPPTHQRRDQAIN